MNKTIQAVIDLVAIIRAGDLLTKKAEVLKLLGEILLGIGDLIDGAQPMVGASLDVPDTLRKCADKLHEELQGVSAAADDEDAPQTVGINPLILILIRRLIKLVVNQLM